MPGLLDIMRAWGPDTCQKEGQYTEENRARGQCCPTALCVQDLKGGAIISTMVGRERHYYNLASDERIDLTAQQYEFDDWQQLTYHDTGHIVDRKQLLRHPDVRRRYEILRSRVGLE